MSSQTFLLRNAPIPFQDRISRPKRNELYGKTQDDPLEGTCSDSWADFLSKLTFSVQAAATRINSVTKTDQAGSIGATDMTGGNLKAGLYTVKSYAQVTQAATVSSSLQVTISWTTHGVAQSESFAAITGNTTATHQAESLGLIFADAGSPVNYATTYASVGGTPMQYALYVVLEIIEA